MRGSPLLAPPLCVCGEIYLTLIDYLTQKFLQFSCVPSPGPSESSTVLARHRLLAPPDNAVAMKVPLKALGKLFRRVVPAAEEAVEAAAEEALIDVISSSVEAFAMLLRTNAVGSVCAL